MKLRVIAMKEPMSQFMSYSEVEHLLAGKTSKETARALSISPRTAEAHRRNLLQKFGVASAKELLLSNTRGSREAPT